MTQVPSKLTVAGTDDELLGLTQIARAAGVRKILSRARFNAGITAERTRITANGTGIYSNGEEFVVVEEARTRAVRLWFTSLLHARTVRVGSSLEFVLAADGNVVLDGTGVPADSLGAQGDYYTDWTANKLYGPRGASAWPSATMALVAVVPSVVSANRAWVSSWSHSGAAEGVGGGRNSWYKWEAETGFNTVRGVVRCYRPLVKTDFIGAIAVSDTGDNSTVNNAWQAMTNGIARTTYDVAGVGWVPLDFVNGQVSADGAAAQTYILRSVPILCNSIQRTDGGARPIVMGRLRHVPGNNSTVYGNVFGTFPTGDLTNRPWSRMNRRRWGNSGDCVADLTLLPPDTDSAFYDAFDFSLEYTFNIPVLSIWNIGDSISENFGQDGWFSRGVLSLSRPDRPIVPSNMGQSGAKSAVWLRQVHDNLDLGLQPPAVLCIPVWTPNDSGTTEETARYASILTLTNRVRALGTKVMLMGGHPLTGARPSDTWGQGIAASGLATFAPIYEVVSNGSGGFFGDSSSDAYPGLHPSRDVGVPIIGAAFQSALQRVLGI